jgi:hypothetical protein
MDAPLSQYGEITMQTRISSPSNSQLGQSTSPYTSNGTDLTKLPIPPRTIVFSLKGQPGRVYAGMEGLLPEINQKGVSIDVQQELAEDAIRYVGVDARGGGTRNGASNVTISVAGTVTLDAHNHPNYVQAVVGDLVKAVPEGIKPEPPSNLILEHRRRAIDGLRRVVAVPVKKQSSAAKLARHLCATLDNSSSLSALLKGNTPSHDAHTAALSSIKTSFDVNSVMTLQAFIEKGLIEPTPALLDMLPPSERAEYATFGVNDTDKKGNLVAANVAALIGLTKSSEASRLSSAQRKVINEAKLKTAMLTLFMPDVDNPRGTNCTYEFARMAPVGGMVGASLARAPNGMYSLGPYGSLARVQATHLSATLAAFADVAEKDRQNIMGKVINVGRGTIDIALGITT